jgi:hypothetical protein
LNDLSLFNYKFFCKRRVIDFRRLVGGTASSGAIRAARTDGIGILHANLVVAVNGFAFAAMEEEKKETGIILSLLSLSQICRPFYFLFN